MTKKTIDNSDLLQLKRLFPIAKKYQMYKLKIEMLDDAKQLLENNRENEQFRLDFCVKESLKLKAPSSGKRSKSKLNAQEIQLKSYELSIDAHKAKSQGIKAELDIICDIIYEYNCFCQANFKASNEYKALSSQYESVIKGDEIYSADCLHECRSAFIKADEKLDLVADTMGDCEKLDTLLSKLKSYVEEMEKRSLIASYRDDSRNLILREKIDETFAHATMLAEAINNKDLCDEIVLKKPKIFLNKEKSFNWIYQNDTVYSGASSSGELVDGYRTKVQRAIESLSSKLKKAHYNRKKAELAFAGGAIDYFMEKADMSAPAEAGVEAGVDEVHI